jgi:hypothetical protein
MPPWVWGWVDPERETKIFIINGSLATETQRHRGNHRVFRIFSNLE